MTTIRLRYFESAIQGHSFDNNFEHRIDDNIILESLVNLYETITLLFTYVLSFCDCRMTVIPNL